MDEMKILMCKNTGKKKGWKGMKGGLFSSIFSWERVKTLLVRLQSLTWVSGFGRSPLVSPPLTLLPPLSCLSPPQNWNAFPLSPFHRASCSGLLGSNFSCLYVDSYLTSSGAGPVPMAADVPYGMFTILREGLDWECWIGPWTRLSVLIVWYLP